MARGRLISKSVGSSRKFHAALQQGGKLGEFAQALFLLIVPNADDYGRLPGDAFTVRHVVFPSSPHPERDFDRALDILANVGLIERYCVEGAVYLQVNQFDEHQPNLHKRSKSKLPEPPGNSRNSGKVAENPDTPGNSEKYRANLTESKLTESNLTEPNPEPARGAEGVSATNGTGLRERFETFWRAYPRRVGKSAAWRAWQQRHPGAELLQQILSALAWQIKQDSWIREAGRYVPNPATWLNAARWEDEPNRTPHVNKQTLALARAGEQFLMEGKS